MERVAVTARSAMEQLRVVDYAPAPGGRFARDGEFSGEWFRDTVLVPALTRVINDQGQLFVNLDDTAGYSSSFLEEAFGGIIRKRIFAPDVLNHHLTVIAESPVYQPYRDLALRYIRDAEQALRYHAA